MISHGTPVRASGSSVSAMDVWRRFTTIGLALAAVGCAAEPVPVVAHTRHQCVVAADLRRDPGQDDSAPLVAKQTTTAATPSSCAEGEVNTSIMVDRWTLFVGVECGGGEAGRRELAACYLDRLVDVRAGQERQDGIRERDMLASAVASLLDHPTWAIDLQWLDGEREARIRELTAWARLELARPVSSRTGP